MLSCVVEPCPEVLIVAAFNNFFCISQMVCICILLFLVPLNINYKILKKWRRKNNNNSGTVLGFMGLLASRTYRGAELL